MSAAGVAPLYSPYHTYRALAALSETGRHLEELKRLLSGRTVYARALSHIEGDFTDAAIEALASIASKVAPESLKARSLLGMLVNDGNPLANPDNLARAVMLGSDAFAEEVMEKGYAAAVPGIGRHLRRLAASAEAVGNAHKARLRSLPLVPGLVFHEQGLYREALKAVGYEPKPCRVYVPARGTPVNMTYLINPTRINAGLRSPEETAARFLAASVLQAVLENRYMLAAYAAADAMAGGGAITIRGPAKAPLIDAGGRITQHASEALAIAEQVFRSAGRNPPKKPFLENYFKRIGKLIRLCEEIAGTRLDYDLRSYYDLYEYTEPARGAVLSALKGVESDGAARLAGKPSDPFRVLEFIHHFIETLPYMTGGLLRLVMCFAEQATLLSLLDIPGGGGDRMEHMRRKLLLSKEAAHLLKGHLIPVYAYAQDSGPNVPRLRGLERLAWATITTETNYVKEPHL